MSCKRKSLRPPKENDPVYLFTKDALTAYSVEDILTQNGIPCIKKGRLGGAITAYIGYTMETFDLFVPFAVVDKARELLDNFFNYS